MSHTPADAARVTLDEVHALLREYHLDLDGHIRIEALASRTARARFNVATKHLRPGDTVSGPTLMALADAALYAAVLGAIGLVPLAVTTSLNINFLHRPAPGDLIADVKLLKVGQRLAVGEVSIHSEGRSEPVAHVTATYSIPPKR
jgi:uncharacterized protein (TIGR00369 family)